MKGNSQAVYDSLGTLTEKGIIRRIQPAGSPARYEDPVGDNHHHLMCRVCGPTVDVDCAVGFTLCLTASDDAGYEIDEAEVTGVAVPSVSRRRRLFGRLTADRTTRRRARWSGQRARGYTRV
jgi:Fe2+ or Zn2+ uptake regulation protein